MNVVIGIVIFALMMLYLIGRIQQSVGKAQERSKHHDRCNFCRARLKKAVGKASWATVCSKCGKTQPWAKA
jgi:ribosomal protein L37AE/L43A